MANIPVENPSANPAAFLALAAALEIGGTFVTPGDTLGLTNGLPESAGYAGAQVLFNIIDGKIYRLVDGEWTSALDAEDIDGILADAQIASLAASKITGLLTNDQLAAIAAAKIMGQLTDDQIADLSAAKVSGQLTNDQLASIAAAKVSGQLSAGQLAAIEATKLVGQVVAAQIASITAPQVTGSLTDAQISELSAAKLTGQVQNVQIASITASKISDAIQAAQIASLTAGQVTGQLTNAQIADLAAAKISGQLTASQLAAIEASKLIGQVIDSQISGLSTSKLSGQVLDAQIAGVAAAKLAGQITTTQITDNAITTGKISAGAVVTASLASGSIIAEKMAIGSGRNMAYNSECIITRPGGASGWGGGYSNTSLTSTTFREVGVWKPAGGNSFCLTYPGLTPATGTVSDITNYRVDETGAFKHYPVEEGQRYELSAWVSSHRCKMHVIAQVLDAYNNAIVAYEGTIVENYQAAQDTPSPIRSWLITPPLPANAKHIAILIRATYTGLEGPYAFASQVLLAKAEVNQTVPSAWAPGVATIMDGSGIVTRSLTADKIVASSITSAEIAAGTIVAGNIAAGAITTGSIAAGAVTTATLAAGAITTPKIAAQAITASLLAIGTLSDNLVVNPGFEEGFATWFRSDTSQISLYPAKFYGFSGNDCCIMQISVPGSSLYIASQIFPVSPTDVYEFAATVASHTYTPYGFYIRAMWYADGGSTYIGQTDIIGNGSAGDRARRSGQVSPPAGATHATFLIYHHSTSTSGWFMIDDVSVKRVVGTTMIADGAITTDKIVANAITAGKVAAGAITTASLAAGSIIAEKLFIGDTSNMIPDFSTGSLSGWHVEAQQNYYQEGYASPALGAWLVESNARDCMSTLRDIMVSAGESYYLSAMVFNTDDAYAATIIVKTTSSAGAINYTIVASTESAFIWVRLEGIFTIPPDCVKIQITLNVLKPSTGGPSTYWTKAIMRRAAGGEMIVDGAITANKITASAITTDKLAAGSVVTAKIAASAVTTEKLSVGFGNNMIYNDECFILSENGTKVSGYGCFSNNTGLTPTVQPGYAPWRPANSLSIDINHSSATPAVGTITDINSFRVMGDGALKDYPAEAGQRYEFSSWISAHRCNCQVLLISKDLSGNYLGVYSGTVIGDTQYQEGTVNAPRSWLITPPLPANTVMLEARVRATYTGGVNPYMFVSQMFLAKAEVGQTTPSAWSPSGATVIDGHGIVTRSLDASKIRANTITSNEILARSIVAGSIVAGAITATEIAAATIVAGNIAAGTITATQIAAATITGANIAAGTIVAGNIAAEQITTEKLSAGAITAVKIAAGAITTEKLSVGSASNLFSNTTFAQGLDTWWGGAAGQSYTTMSLRAAGESWAGRNYPTLMVYQDDAQASGYFDVRWKKPGSSDAGTDTGIAATPGQTYEVSFQYSLHRCAAEIRLEFRLADGSFAYGGYAYAPENSQSGTDPDSWVRLVGRGVAPANAVAVGVLIRKLWTQSGGNSYLFLHKPLICKCPPNATEPTEWSEGGVTQIAGGGIVAGSVAAAHIAAGAIIAGKIAAGVITTTELAAGSVTTAKVAAGAIAADQIAANAVVAGKVAANAIIAGNIAANAVIAGTVAAGAINTDQLVARSITTDTLAIGNVTEDILALFSATRRTSASWSGLSTADQYRNLTFWAPAGATILLQHIGSGPTGQTYAIRLGGRPWINVSVTDILPNYTTMLNARADSSGDILLEVSAAGSPSVVNIFVAVVVIQR